MTWTVTTESPLAWGGWAFRLTNGDTVKDLEWWPGDRHLRWMQRPMLAAPVKATGKDARRAAHELCALLNEDAAA